MSVQVKQIHYEETQSNSITTFEVGKLKIKLFSKYGEKTTLDELLYPIACRKIMERLETRTTPLCS